MLSSHVNTCAQGHREEMKARITKEHQTNDVKVQRHFQFAADKAQSPNTSGSLKPSGDLSRKLTWLP